MNQYSLKKIFCYYRTASQEYMRLNSVPPVQPPSYATLYGTATGKRSFNEDSGLPEVSVHTPMLGETSRNFPSEQPRGKFPLEEETCEDC